MVGERLAMTGGVEKNRVDPFSTLTISLMKI